MRKVTPKAFSTLLFLIFWIRMNSSLNSNLNLIRLDLIFFWTPNKKGTWGVREIGFLRWKNLKGGMGILLGMWGFRKRKREKDFPLHLPPLLPHILLLLWEGLRETKKHLYQPSENDLCKKTSIPMRSKSLWFKLRPHMDIYRDQMLMHSKNLDIHDHQLWWKSIRDKVWRLDLFLLL